LQRQFYVAWVTEPDAVLIAAVAEATGAGEVRVLPTWWGCEKRNGALPVPEPGEGLVNLEFQRCSDRAMEFSVFGPGVRRARADLGRAIALASGRPLLFSDCNLFPWSYFMAREDGAIVNVAIHPTDEDIFELMPEDPADPDGIPRTVVFAPDEPLPTAPDLPELDPPRRCAVFGGPCPKRADICADARPSR
jgi:hypothetical protein